MKKIALLLLLAPLAFSAETIYAWGYGDILGESLKMVKYMLSYSGYNDMWKLVLLLSSFVGTITMMFPNSDPFKLPKIFFISTGVWAMFVTAKIDVYIDDKVNANNSMTILQVPWAVGYPFALFSQFEKVSGETYEIATSTPAGINYTNSGFFTPVSIFKTASEHKIVNPTLNQNLDNYIIDCVMPDIESGYKDYGTLISSTNVWSYIGNTNPATFVLYKKDDGTQELKGCDNFYNTINTAMNDYIANEGMEFLGHAIGITSSTAISSLLGTSASWMLGASKSATSTLLQTTSINMFNESFKRYTMVNGVSDQSTAYYAAKGEQQAQANMVISGILGSKYVPIIKGILTTIVAGLTPLIALLTLTPLGLKTFLGYITILMWLSLWHVGDIILNHIISVKAQAAVSSVSSDITFAVKGIMDTQTTDYINMASSMYWMVPTIAMLLVTGMSIMTLNGMSGGMTQRSARGENAGTEMAGGDMKFGNIQHSTYRANQFDGMNSHKSGNSFIQQDMAGKSENGNFTGSGLNQNDTNLGGRNASMLSQIDNAMLNRQMGNIGEGFGSTSSNLTGSGNWQNVGNGSFVSKASNTYTDNNGNMVTANTGSIMKQEGGSMKPYSGTFAFSGKDENGNNVNLESAEYMNGNLIKHKATDDTGVAIETSKLGGIETSNYSIGGTKVTTVKEGSGKEMVTGAVIDGQTYSKEDMSAIAFNRGVVQNASNIKQHSNGQGNTELTSEQHQAIGATATQQLKSTGTTTTAQEQYLKSTSNVTGRELMEAYRNNVSQGNGTDKTDTTGDNKSAHVGASAKIDSSNSILGKAFSFVTGASGQVDAGAKYEMSNSDQLKITRSNGETKSFDLSESDKKAWNETFGKNIAEGKTTTGTSQDSKTGTDTESDTHSRAIMNQTAENLINSATYGTTLNNSSSNSFSSGEKLSKSMALVELQDRIDNRGAQSVSDVVADVNKNKFSTSPQNNTGISGEADTSHLPKNSGDVTNSYGGSKEIHTPTKRTNVSDNVGSDVRSGDVEKQYNQTSDSSKSPFSPVEKIDHEKIKNNVTTAVNKEVSNPNEATSPIADKGQKIKDVMTTPINAGEVVAKGADTVLGGTTKAVAGALGYGSETKNPSANDFSPIQPVPQQPVYVNPMKHEAAYVDPSKMENSYKGVIDTTKTADMSNKDSNNQSKESLIVEPNQGGSNQFKK